MQQVNWPCLLKLDGENELTHLPSEQVLQEQCEALIWTDSDYIIDSRGASYTFYLTQSNALLFELRPITYTLDAVTALIQAHEFSQAATCLTKMQFVSVEQAVDSLRRQ